MEIKKERKVVSRQASGDSNSSGSSLESKSPINPTILSLVSSQGEHSYSSCFPGQTYIPPVDDSYSKPNSLESKNTCPSTPIPKQFP